MQTRRHVLASIPALAFVPAAAQPAARSDIRDRIDEILQIVQARDGGMWTVHEEPDFILISRKL